MDEALLTRPQAELLDELREAKDGLYIRKGSRWDRTVKVLERHGLVHCDERDLSGQGMNHWLPVAPLPEGAEPLEAD